MREDDEIGHYVPLLRRIIILVAVITAIPVVLWTITAFVRSYVGPPKIPTFHQLASTASINAPVDNNFGQSAGQNKSQDATDRMMADAAKQAKLADPSATSVEAKASVMDARSSDPAPKGPFLGDRPAETATITPAITPISNAPAPSTTAPGATVWNAAPPSTPKMADMSSAVPTQPAAQFKPTEMPAPAATANATTASVTLAGQEPVMNDSLADAMATAAPLSGPVPLPRRRPHVVADSTPAEAPAIQTAPMTRMASAGPIPMPRPRPDAAGPGSPAEPASSGPLDFIQNLFGGK
jgi:hypothetical protein